MPMYLDRSTESALSTLFNETFINKLKKYLGYDSDTPEDDIPVDVEDLLSHAISTCEQEQWRFILPKEVVLYLPYEALCEQDKLLFLPFGPLVVSEDSGQESITISFINTSDVTTEIAESEYRRYEGEPIRLWCNDWLALVPNIKTEDPYPITVTYTAGYTAFNQIPLSTVRALKILCYHYDSFREAIGESSIVATPSSYCHNRDLALLNDRRAIKYITDDWAKVNPR